MLATDKLRLSTRRSFPRSSTWISSNFTEGGMQLWQPTTTLFRCECVMNGPGRCWGKATGVLVALVVLAVLEPLSSFRAGRLGEEKVGLLIEDGGVMELWEFVSIVEEDLPATTSTLEDGLLESVEEWKLAFDRRRSCLRNDMATGSNVAVRDLFSPGEEPPPSWRECQSGHGCRNWEWAWAWACQEQESATVCGRMTTPQVSSRKCHDKPRTV